MPVYIGRLKCAHCGHSILSGTQDYPDAAQAQVRLTSALFGHSTLLRIPSCPVCESTRMRTTVNEQREHYIWRSNAAGDCTFLGDLWFRITGHRPGSDLGHDWKRSILPDDLIRLWGAYSRATEERRPYSCRYRLRRADRSFAWMYTKGYPVFESDKSFMGFWGFAIEL